MTRLAWDGQAVIELFREEEPRLIVVGMSLKKISGLHLARFLRGQQFLGVILVWNEGEADEDFEEKVQRAGADGVIAHPFEAWRFLRQAKRLLLKAGYLWPGGKAWQAGDLTLEHDTRRVERDGQTIRLRNKEFLLLELLLKNQGKVLTRQDLWEAVWGSNGGAGGAAGGSANQPFSSNTVNSHVASLRAKVERGFEKKLIQTVHGVGYRVE